MKRPVFFLLALFVLVPASWAQSGRMVSLDGIKAAPVATGPIRQEAAPIVRRMPELTVGADAAQWAARMTGTAPGFSSGKGSAALARLDATARRLLASRAGLGKNAAALADAVPAAAVSVQEGAVFVDVMADLAPGASTAALEVLGAEVQTRVGDIVMLRVPLDVLEAVAAQPGVREIETSQRRHPTMFASRADIRADLVHAGVGLPGPVQGEGVVVGVLDSGLDVTHPDFFNEGGSRVRFLRELQNGNTHADWTKAQIDANPALVSERDGDGGGGHGTHVTGTAAGGGRADASMRGIAPKSDLVFVKGIRDAGSNGGFSDNDVVAGVQYIFDRATALGEPAVVNLSLGGNGGPLDGTALQDRALSDLVGPGRIIVAAGGNEGFDLIHAGGTNVPGKISQTMMVLEEGTTFALADVWYEQGAVTEIGLAAYYVEGGVLTLAEFSGWMPVGNAFANWEPFEYEGETIAEYALDAGTTQDPGNGDGNAVVYLRGNEQIDPSQWIWGVVTRGTQADRLDLWAQGGEFLDFAFGLTDYTEMVGNTDQTLGSPASGDRIIAVASYVTTNTWSDLDGARYEARNPSPTRDGTAVVPVIGQRSYFSSIGPRRDGRQKPDIAAPGERIFSTLSSHLTEGVGYQRSSVLAGGRYVGMQGTSMASPHITGVVALMLQVNPTLDYDAALDILQETARVDVQTGTLPDVQWGAGRVDALAAVQEALRRAGGNPGGGVQRATLSRFDPSGTQRNFSVDQVLPIDSGFVAGMNLYGDRAKATAFDLPASVTTAEVTEVNVWFGYKKPGATRPYAIEIYAGTPASGPTGAALFRQEFSASHAVADADLGTPEAPTVHTLSTPVRVNGPFYVNVDFGAYAVGEAGALTIATTGAAGGRVPQVWEQWSNGSWHNLSDAWWGSNGAPGTDGIDLWVQAGVQYAASTPVEGGEQPGTLSLRLAGPNPFHDATTLAYGVPQTGPVSLEVYDLLGRRVATLVDGVQPAGSYTVPFAPDALAGGLYLARLEAAGRILVQRLVLVE